MGRAGKAPGAFSTPPPPQGLVAGGGEAQVCLRSLHGGLAEGFAQNLSQGRVAARLVVRRGGEGTSWDSRLPYLLVGGDPNSAKVRRVYRNTQYPKPGVNSNEAVSNRILISPVRKVFKLCK